MLLVLSPTQVREEKDLPEEGRILLTAQDLAFDTPLEIEPAPKLPPERGSAIGYVFRSRRQAILRSHPGMNKPIFGKCLYPGPGYTKKKSASKLTPFRKK